MRARAVAVAVALVLVLSACGGGSGSKVEAGKKTFVDEGCGSCHTVAAAGTTGSLGPNLGEALVPDAQAASRPLDEFVRESIVNPNGFINPRYLADTMPTNYGNLLSAEQLDDLVSFLVDAAQP